MSLGSPHVIFSSLEFIYKRIALSPLDGTVLQIVVPADLADVLKAYTKEVIRRQPENLIEFSAK